MEKNQDKVRENPYEEKLKDGFIRLPNEMIEKVYQQYFRPNENKVFWFIVRKTWGWKKFKEFINLSQFENSLKLKKDKICKALSSLKQRNIIAQLDNKNSKIKPGKGKGNFIAQLDKDQKIAQLDNGIAQLDNKFSVKHTPTANPQTPKDTYLKDNKQQQQEETLVSSAAVNSSFSIKPETQKKLREWHISNGNIRELILKVMKFSDNVDDYFQDWIAFIKENPKIKNPAGFLIKMVGKKSEPYKEKLSYTQNQINLREAKIDLEKNCTANRIYEWLKKIDRPYHSELQKHLKRIYPEGKAYFEAEIRYDREKVR